MVLRSNSTASSAEFNPGPVKNWPAIGFSLKWDEFANSQQKLTVFLQLGKVIKRVDVYRNLSPQ